MIRLFLALDFPGDTLDKLILLRDSVVDKTNFKWEPKEKLHLTLKFIGDFDDKKTQNLIESLSFLNNEKRVAGEINKFGFFFRDKDPKILWAGMDVSSNLLTIINKVEDRLFEFSVKKEKREFKPHLTLLRLKNNPGENFINSFKNFTFEPVKFISKTITLFESKLLPQGSKYFELFKYKLRTPEEL